MAGCADDERIQLLNSFIGEISMESHNWEVSDLWRSTVSLQAYSEFEDKAHEERCWLLARYLPCGNAGISISSSSLKCLDPILGLLLGFPGLSV